MRIAMRRIALGALIQKGLLALGLLAAVAFLPRLVRRLRGRPASGLTLTFSNAASMTMSN